MTMSTFSYRQPTTYERQVIERLLEVNFLGQNVIFEQINSSLVTKIDENGSLKFNVKIRAKANVKQRVPIEAECEDVDGVTIHVLLHVVDGIVDELEIYKDDSSLVIKMPDPKDLRLFEPG